MLNAPHRGVIVVNFFYTDIIISQPLISNRLLRLIIIINPRIIQFILYARLKNLIFYENF